MDKSDNQDSRDDPTGGTGPQESPGPMRKWLDNFLTPGEAGAERPADPIARNPKDEGKPGEAVQAMEVRHRREVAVPAEGLARLAGLTGRFPPHPAPSVADLLASILRFKWTILIVWILVSAPIIAVVWTQITPKYEARAEIRIRPIIPRLVFKTDENSQIPFYESFVNTQVALIRGEVLQRVVEQDKVQNTRWYRSPPQSLLGRLQGHTVAPIERLRDSLSVRPRPRTEIIDVSFMDANPEEARTIVNTIMEQYRSYIQTDRSKDKLDEQLEKEYDTRKARIGGLESSRAIYYEKLQTDNPQELITSHRVRLDELKMRLQEVATKIRLLTKMADVDSNDAPPTAADGSERRPKYYEDQEWRKLNTDVNNIEHQMDIYTDTSEHPARKRLEKELAFAKGLRQARATQLDELWQERSKSTAAGLVPTTGVYSGASADATVSVEQELARAIEEEKSLNDVIKMQTRDFNDLFENAKKFEEYNTSLRQERELFDAVRQRKEQKDVERIVDTSFYIGTNGLIYSSTQPANDRRIVFTVMALMAGLGLGGGAGFLRASRNQTIYAPRDMPQPARVPLLGYMPLIHLDKPVGEALSKEIEQKQGVLIESVRVLRTALLTRLNGQGRTTVVVTSANRGTGKSSVTLVLGKSIAHAGRRVLLIDADFHRMGLSKRLNMANRPGFRESLKDGTAENLHVFPTGTAGLDVMPAGLRGKDSSVFDEIAHDAFKSWLGRLFERYGYQIVLLDTPPLLPVADAAILAGQADATILVEREHVSRRAEVASALLLLGSAGGHLLGTVFVGSANDDQYGYGYGYGYGCYDGSARES